jgi:transcriptional regulator with XRE-family HTH domain
MPNFTYLPGPEDAETVQTCGFSFTAGEWTPIPDDHFAVEKLRGNRFFAEQDGANSGADQTAPEINKMVLNGSGLHDSGSGEDREASPEPNKITMNIREPTPVDLSPLQCRAARAGLEWSREQLAKAAKIGERTVTDFERHASNMLTSKKTAVRKAFEAAGVTFDGSNGVWFAEPSPAAQNSGETDVQNESPDATEADGEPLAA